MSTRVQRPYSSIRSSSFSINSKRNSSSYTPSSMDYNRYSSSRDITRANSISSRSSVTRNSMIFPSTEYRPSTKPSLARSASFCALPVSNRDYSLTRSRTLAEDVQKDFNVSHEGFERRVEAFQKTSRALNKALRDSQVRDMTPEEKAQKIQVEQMRVERTSQQEWQDFLTRQVLLVRACDIIRKNPRGKMNKQSWIFEYSSDGPSSPEEYDVPSDTELVIMKTY